MLTPAVPRRKIGLLAITGCLAGLVWLVVGIVLVIMLRQQSRIESDAQHIYDVSSAKVYEATRTIRALERLAREGDSLNWVSDPLERTTRRQAMQTVFQDASLQGDPEIRALVLRSFSVLDANLEELGRVGVSAQAGAAARWKPVLEDLSSRSEAEGAAVAALATQEADNILISTEEARQMLLLVGGAMGVGSLVLFGFLYLALTRPVVRLARSLLLAREGQPIADDEEMIRELQMLHDAAVALGGAHIALEAARTQMEQQAHTDALTGLHNRRMFEVEANQAFAHAKRHDEALSLVVFDIDHFKRINDQHGHEGGDIVLRALGAFLTDALRDADRPVARTGGEEFALLLSLTPLPIALQIAERLRRGISQLVVPLPTGDNLHVTVSLGVAQCRAQDDDMGALSRRADAALYKAKQNGRDRVEPAA